jgi:hypothetical protein
MRENLIIIIGVLMMLGLGTYVYVSTREKQPAIECPSVDPLKIKFTSPDPERTEESFACDFPIWGGGVMTYRFTAQIGKDMSGEFTLPVSRAALRFVRCKGRDGVKFKIK